MAWRPSTSAETGKPVTYNPDTSRYFSSGPGAVFQSSGWTKLDPSRSWKTTWGGNYQAHHYASGRYMDRKYLPLTTPNQKRNAANYAWNLTQSSGGPVYGTGRSRTLYEYDSGDYDWDPYGYALERLDFGAYNKDPLYKNAWKGLGRKGNISSMQGILDAEAFMAGTYKSPVKDKPTTPTTPTKPKNPITPQPINVSNIQAANPTVNPITSTANPITNTVNPLTGTVTNLTGQVNNLTGQISDLNTKISDNQQAYDKSIKNLSSQLSYGYSPQQQTQGVQSLGKIANNNRTWGGISQSFGRKGQRITSLNI